MSLVQEEEMLASQAMEMETKNLHEASSCKPEKQGTEMEESPLLMERQIGDAHEASKITEIPVATHPSVGKVNP